MGFSDWSDERAVEMKSSVCCEPLNTSLTIRESFFFVIAEAIKYVAAHPQAK